MNDSWAGQDELHVYAEKVVKSARSPNKRKAEVEPSAAGKASAPQKKAKLLTGSEEDKDTPLPPLKSLEVLFFS